MTICRFCGRNRGMNTPAKWKVTNAARQPSSASKNKSRYSRIQFTVRLQVYQKIDNLDLKLKDTLLGDTWRGIQAIFFFTAICLLTGTFRARTPKRGGNIILSIRLSAKIRAYNIYLFISWKKYRVQLKYS